MKDRKHCWSCGVEFLEPVALPWEPICDECYPVAVEESRQRMEKQ